MVATARMGKEREMTLKQLASLLSKQEGKKHQASVGDVREIIGLICDVLHANPGLSAALAMNGRRRANKKK